MQLQLSRPIGRLDDLARAQVVLDAVDVDYDVQTRVTGLDELRVRRPGE